MTCRYHLLNTRVHISTSSISQGRSGHYGYCNVDILSTYTIRVAHLEAYPPASTYCKRDAATVTKSLQIIEYDRTEYIQMYKAYKQTLGFHERRFRYTGVPVLWLTSRLSLGAPSVHSLSGLRWCNLTQSNTMPRRCSCKCNSCQIAKNMAGVSA